MICRWYILDSCGHLDGLSNQRWPGSYITKISLNKSRAAAAWPFKMLFKCCLYAPICFADKCVVLGISYLMWSSTKHVNLLKRLTHFCVCHRVSQIFLKSLHLSVSWLVTEQVSLQYINVQQENTAGLFLAAVHRRNAYLLRWVWQEGNPLKGEINCSNPSSAHMHIVLRQLYLCVRLQCH